MGIFDQYGIKEVADVTIYSIHKKKDGSGDVYYVPALYLDTLKISTTEKTAENVWAQGGLGNARLICWDYGKQINVTLEDALCTPASLGLCWGGVLSSNWKDGHVEHDLGISFNDKNPVERLSRMEKAFYPSSNRKNVSNLLPQLKSDDLLTDVGGEEKTILSKSSIVDGTKVIGFGYVNNRTYKWRLGIESNIKSIAQIPNKFFDIYGKSYKIANQTTITVKSPSSNIDDFKYEVCYSINPDDAAAMKKPEAAIIIDKTEPIEVQETEDMTTYDALKTAKFLKIRVRNDNSYVAFLSNSTSFESTKENKYVNVEQFKGLDMWLRFSSINEMIYFILTKYENDIFEIKAAHYDPESNEKSNNPGAKWELQNDEETNEISEKEGKLWAYVNPKTMAPYDDDYWFNQGEPYYIKSLTFAPEKKKLKSQKIIVTAGQFPGMYMIVGETYIRSRDTGEDERMQIKFPLCKIKSDQTLTLEAEGDPTTFNMDVEVAKPASGIMMELTSYEVAKKMVETEEGYYIEKDGSTEVLSE